MRRSRLGAAFLSLAPIACSPPPIPNLSAACDSAVLSLAPVRVRPAPIVLARTTRYGDTSGADVQAVVGVAWGPASGRVYVLDGRAQRGVIFDSSGRRTGWFGAGIPLDQTGHDEHVARHVVPSAREAGRGPGAFSELPTVYRRNVIVVMPDDRVVVKDVGSLHIFAADGRPLAEHDLGPELVRSIAPGPGGRLLLARDHSLDLEEPDWTRRTRITLSSVRLSPRLGRPTPLGVLHNYLALRPPSDSGDPASGAFPYARRFHRYFAGLESGLMAVPSQRSAGVCFFGSDGTLAAAYRLAVQPARVDSLERAHVLGSRGDSVLAMLGRTRAEFMQGAWPHQVPLAVDIALGPDSIAWVHRALPGNGSAFDLYRFGAGYVGSWEAAAPGMPQAFVAGCPVFVRQASQGEALERWCPLRGRESGSGDSRNIP